MENQTFQSVKQSVANGAKYVQPQLYGSNAATTDIVRLEPKDKKAA